jgi:hypothetical protein
VTGGRRQRSTETSSPFWKVLSLVKVVLSYGLNWSKTAAQSRLERRDVLTSG